jgi:hypothetical protein
MEDWSWVERYQTLISGILAICAALIAAVAIYHSAQAPLKAERRFRAEEAGARRRAHALALRVDVQDLVDKAGDIQHVMSHPGGGPPQVGLNTPASLQDWHLAAAHAPPIPDQIESLILTLRQYQDLVGMGGWKSGDVYAQVEIIGDDARALVKAIDSEYDRSTPS